MKLMKLTHQLESLACKAHELDELRGENFTPLFDSQLFCCRAKQLLPCVKEAQANLAQLVKMQQQKPSDPLKIHHFCHKLVDQISALQREFQLVSLRKKQQKYQPQVACPQKKLQQELLQHQEWERRLLEMVKEADKQLKFCQVPAQKTLFQHRLLVAEGRLARCSAKRKKIEQQFHLINFKG